MTQKNYNDMSAVKALQKAQYLAVSPFIFQAVVSMKRFGILAHFGKMNCCESVSRGELAEIAGISDYAVSVLMDLAVVADLVICNDDGSYTPTKVCHYLANDRMTNVNLDFSADLCYEGLKYLPESLQNGSPKGLKVFTSSYNTIYPFISSLPPKSREAWLNFDHYYSDNVFGLILPVLFRERKFTHINDIGGNTGRFAIEAANFDKDVRVTIIDLPQQCELAENNVLEHGLSERIDTYPVNILDESTVLPTDGDLWWMSQFLDCFSHDQIVDVLTMVYNAMDDGAMLAVCEIFGDRQTNDIARLVIEANSLYFTALANGVSRFYHSDEFLKMVTDIGFKVYKEKDGIGLAHTLLLLTK